ncbi:MAG TPA: 1,4-dihydroxy-2-naphthoate polyprenyltransferase [Edaphocola sp.]|nr:1,4-dihydroxy-2-naphthoate polyprenyltransferase [Edaphocola sp.]
MKKTRSWLKAFRLRTLPLSFSSVLLGSFLAISHWNFNIKVMIWALITTLFLQILSNLANDYGDSSHGVDNQNRIGPKRSIQSGEISIFKMKIGIIVFAMLSLCSGLYLLFIGTKGLQKSSFLIMLILGLLAIVAALKYTMGKNPYGYTGLGDISVFLFFGLTGVLGTLFLHTHKIILLDLLPALSVGFFSTGVLNINNLRDEENDKAFGKNTMVVRLGSHKSKIYHAILICAGMAATFIYTLMTFKTGWEYLYLLCFPFFIKDLVTVLKNKIPATLDSELKKLALTCFVFTLLFGMGILL